MHFEEIFLEKDRLISESPKKASKTPQNPLLVHKKTKEGYPSPHPLGQLSRCDFCLEFSLYSDSQLLECISCKATIHDQCQVGIGAPKTAWQCERCTFANKNKQSYTFYRYTIYNFSCQLCGDSSGYLTRIGKSYAHVRCVRFIPELFSEEEVYDDFW
jgi:hypothetical protein